MKLRSGKVLGSNNMDILPDKLAVKLEENLKYFKELFGANPKHAKELLDIINSAKGIGMRFEIYDKIEEISTIDSFEEQRITMLGVAGELCWLVVGIDCFYKENNIEPMYRDAIESRIKDFGLELDLLGDHHDCYE